MICMNMFVGFAKKGLFIKKLLVFAHADMYFAENACLNLVEIDVRNVIRNSIVRRML